MGQVCCSGESEEKKQDIFHDRSALGVSNDGNDILVVDNNNNSNYVNDQGAMMITQQEPGGGIGSSNDSGSGNGALSSSPGERLEKMREEHARLELIVQNAGRGMVAVRSMRGSTGYYDQGFAAALAQHLEQTTKFPNQLPIRLPPPPNAFQLNSNDINTAAAKTSTATKTASSSLTNAINKNKNAISSDSKANDASSGGGTSSPEAAGSRLLSASSRTVYARLSQPLWEGITLGIKGGGLAGCAGENPYTYMDHVAVSYLDSIVPKKERLFAGVGPIVENLL